MRDRTVTVGAFPSVIDTLLIPVVIELREANPPINTRIVEARENLNATHAALRAGLLDIALVKHGDTSQLPEDIVETIIRDDPYRIVVPARWPTPAALTGLLDVPWVGQPSGSPGREPLARIEANENVTLRYEYECTEYPVTLAIVEAGLAAAVVPTLAIPRNLSTAITVLEIGDLGHRRIAAHHIVGRTTMGIVALVDALRRSAPGRLLTEPVHNLPGN